VGSVHLAKVIDTFSFGNMPQAPNSFGQNNSKFIKIHRKRSEGGNKKGKKKKEKKKRI
jgi:hypothetical protein